MCGSVLLTEVASLTALVFLVCVESAWLTSYTLISGSLTNTAHLETVIEAVTSSVSFSLEALRAGVAWLSADS